MVKLDGASKKRTDYRTEYPVQLYGKRKKRVYMRLKGLFFLERCLSSLPCLWEADRGFLVKTNKEQAEFAEYFPVENALSGAEASLRTLL